jgi:hypothetical protein
MELIGNIIGKFTAAIGLTSFFANEAKAHG